MTGTAVCKSRCRHCLFGDESIAEPGARERIIAKCAKGNTHFVCHEATERGADIMCRGWWDECGDLSNLGRSLMRLGFDPDESGWSPTGPATDPEYAASTRAAKRSVAVEGRVAS